MQQQIKRAVRRGALRFLNKNNNLHIDILKYGRDQLDTGVSFQQLSKYISEQGHIVNEAQLDEYFWDSYDPIELVDRRDKRKALKDGKQFSLTMESTFRLIEYEEFVSANRSSFWASAFAIAAIVISIISFCFSIYYSNKQLTTDTKLNAEQLNSITKIKYDDTYLQTAIEKLITNQKKLIKSIERNSCSRNEAAPHQ